MSATVSCKHCGKRYQAPPSLAGRHIRCKACGEGFQIPGPDVPLTAELVAGDADTDDSLPGMRSEPRSSPASAMPLGTPSEATAKPPTGTSSPYEAAQSYSGGQSFDGRQRRADEIDYEIYGHEAQYCEITLDPGEQVLAEAGAMMYMTDGIEMKSVFGDPSKQGGNFIDRAFGAGKRLLTGESLFMTTFTNTGGGRRKVAFGSPYPGRMIPLHLDELGGEIICQKDAFLCGARGIHIDIAFQKKIGAGLFGGEGFIMQRLKGDGIAVIHAGGTMMHQDLRPGEKLRLDTGCLLAVGPSVTYDVEFVGGLRNAFFGGEGLFMATVVGPGPVWLQSLPFSRLAGRVIQSAPQGGGKRTGEGSVLGGLGDMFMGD